MHSYKLTQKSLIIVAAGALLLTACGQAENAQSGGENEELTRLVVGLSDEPANSAPGQATSTVPLTLNALVHRGLMAYDDQGELIPGLAESVETEDNQVFDIHLREDLTFADGEPLTAENVQESYNYLSNPESQGAANPGLTGIDDIEIVSDTELTFTLEEPNNAFMQYLAIPTAAVFPSSSLESEEDTLEGAGPYQIEEHTQGQRMLLTKNEHFYDADNIALEEIELVFYSDGTARTNALLSGDVDFIDYVPWEEFENLEANENIVLDTQNGPFMYALFNTEDGPFSDPLLRQAVGYAINRQNTVDAAFAGNGQPVYGIPVAEEDAAYDPEWEHLFEEDMNEARELIEKSGFDTSEEITLLTNSQYSFHEDVALSVLSDLEELGLSVTMEAPDWATRTQRASEGDYDILVNGNVGQVTDLAFLSFFVDGNDGPAKSWGYQNDELAGLIQEGMSANTDEDKKEAFDQVRELWAEDVPFVMVNQRGQAHAYNADVTGFSTLPGFLSFYSGYSFMYIE